MLLSLTEPDTPAITMNLCRSYLTPGHVRPTKPPRGSSPCCLLRRGVCTSASRIPCRTLRWSAKRKDTVIAVWWSTFYDSALALKCEFAAMTITYTCVLDHWPWRGWAMDGEHFLERRRTAETSWYEIVSAFLFSWKLEVHSSSIQNKSSPLQRCFLFY